jgi:lipoprotein NlpI
MTKLCVLAVVLCTAFAGPAAASTYSDFNAGIAAFKRMDMDAALTHLNAALAAPDLNPAFRPAAYFDRAQIFAFKMQWKNAIADFGSALAADPLYLDAYEARARCYAATGQLDLAIADLSTLITQKPALPTGYMERGNIYLVQNNLDAAIADFTAVISLTPDAPWPHAGRAHAYRRQGDTAKAMDDIDKAIDMDSQQPSYFLNRAALYQLTADYRHAAKDYESAAALKPSDMSIVMQQGIVAWKQNDLSAANAFFTKVRGSSDKVAAPYAALWAVIAAGLSDADKSAAADLSRANWPGPILDLYFGGASPSQMMKAAAIGNVKAQTSQLCEANFYGAEWYLLHGNADAAKPMLAAAAANCPDDFVERDAAVFAQQKLGRP